MKHRVRALLAGCLAALVAAPAFAACPIELAIYRDKDGVAEIDFRPAEHKETATNQFRLLMAGDVALSGAVVWTNDLKRPVGMLQYNCPDGEASPEALADCTVWQGVVYSASQDGKAGLLPPEGQDAPKSLILADLAFDLSVAELLKDKLPKSLPSDIFELSGCQE